MARIYEPPDADRISGTVMTPAAGLNLSGAARGGDADGEASGGGGTGTLVTVVAAAAVAGALFGVVYGDGRNLGQALAAGVAGALGVAGARALRVGRRRRANAVPIVTPPARLAMARPDRRLEMVLEQLDDRFSVFRGVEAEGVPLDYLLVGPSGLFAAVDASGDDHADDKAMAALRTRATAQAGAVKTLLARLIPTAPTDVEAVVCVAPGTGAVARDHDDGPWTVSADLIAPALLRRSGVAGSIGRDVDQTGAFSADAMRRAAIEHVLVDHWKVAARKTAADYTP